ncbi:MAG: spore coat protein U domain-containing protein [Sphingomonas phyllosphaerae]|uniref:spore coat protein U domain-containing protein n=1 Tax=Sphingomonas phyllosphaerae TaxID=257003 RepID=UPI002FF519A6
MSRAIPSPSSNLWRALLLTLAVLMGTIGATPAMAAACTATTLTTTDLGSFSPSAIATSGAVPALRSRAGLVCTPGLLKVLSGNYIKATFQSRNALKLASATAGAPTLSYVLSADPNNTVPIAQNGTIDYMQGDLLNLLGLLGGTSADLPFFVRPLATAALPEGVYTDRLTIKWDWYLCQGIGALGACILGLEKDTATTVVDITLTVAARKLVLTASSRTTWDPVNGSTFPKAVPGGKRRVSVQLNNPDIVATDGNVTVVMPIAPRQTLALDGDGISAGLVTFTVTPSGGAVALAYDGPASASDDVDFSADQGLTWNYIPGPGSVLANAVRFRPRGRVPAGTTLDFSVPVTVR